MADPALADSFNDQLLKNIDGKVDSMSPRKRILYEIQELLRLETKDLEIETITKKSCGTGRPRIPNRDLYRIYKGLLQEKNVRPSMIYTGNDVMEFNEAKSLVDDAGKQINDLEPTI